MSIDVSIIVPIYNGEKHLDKCLSSLLSQNTCCKYEIIAVNDGSTDGTKDLLEKWERRSSIISVHTKPNSGPSAARNKGLLEAKGKYVIFVDIDDLVSCNYIDNLYVVASKETSPGVVVSGLFVNRKGEKEKLHEIIPRRYLNSEFEDMLNEQNICHNGYSVSKLYTKEIIDKYHIRFDEHIRYGEDLLFYLKYLIYAHWATFIDQYDYYYNSNNVGSLILSYNTFDSEFEGFVKLTHLLCAFQEKYKVPNSKMDMSFGWSGHFAYRAISTIERPGRYYVEKRSDRIAMITGAFVGVDLQRPYMNCQRLELKERIMLMLAYHKMFSVLDLFAHTYFKIRYNRWIRQIIK